MPVAVLVAEMMQGLIFFKLLFLILVVIFPVKLLGIFEQNDTNFDGDSKYFRQSGLLKLCGWILCYVIYVLLTENPCLTPAAAAEAAALLTPSLLNTLVANSAWALVRLAPVAR